MPHRDAVSSMVLIGVFVKKGQFEQALEWFREMQLSGVEPDYVTIIAVIAACADLGTLGLGLWINRFFVKQDFRDNIRISNSVIICILDVAVLVLLVKSSRACLKGHWYHGTR
ncbi:hypothetical protein CerSpe_237290 [Prunus speciosa]